MKPVTENTRELLEGMIDMHSLAEVLDLLAGICAEKADHIRTNWQDAPLATAWDAAGRAVSRAADTYAVRRLP